MLLDYKKLWDEQGYGKDNPYARSIAFAEKAARREELHRDVTQAIIGEFFLELAAGKKYPLDKCPCGCGIDKSGTAATHALTGRISHAGDQMREFRGEVIANAVNEKILWHMSEDNAEYTKKFMSPKRKRRVAVHVLIPLVPAITILTLVLIYG